jgi:ribosomal protein L12E/L44/L45/RPP1/RPP2
VPGNAFKTLVAITVELENYSFAEAAPYEAFVKVRTLQLSKALLTCLQDPTAFAAAAVEVAPDAGAGATAAPAPVAEVKKEEEPEEEIDLGGGMDMFGGEAAGGGDY